MISFLNVKGRCLKRINSVNYLHRLFVSSFRNNRFKLTSQGISIQACIPVALSFKVVSQEEWPSNTTTVVQILLVNPFRNVPEILPSPKTVDDCFIAEVQN